jgi:hypothetical protein
VLGNEKTTRLRIVQHFFMQNGTSLLVRLCVVIEHGDSEETWWTSQDG